MEVLTNASPLTQIMAHLDEAAHRLSKSGTTHYAMLELKKGASPEDIKKAYRFRLQLLTLTLTSYPGISPLNLSLSTLLSDPFLNPRVLTLGHTEPSSISLWHGTEFRPGLLASILGITYHAFFLHIQRPFPVIHPTLPPQPFPSHPLPTLLLGIA